MHTRLAVLLALACLFGCRADLQHGLTEPEANEILVLLAENGVAGNKVAEGAANRWAVQVPTADATHAWQILQASGLPRRRVEGFAETFGEPGLIPSPAEERARLLRATAGDLERSIMSMQSVLDVRVHLVQPAPLRWGATDAAAEPAQASVLVVYRSGGSGSDGVDVEAVRRLVSGAVADLPAERVEVVTASRERMVDNAHLPVSKLGPFTVGRGSYGPLRLLLALGGALVVALSAALVFLLLRSRRFRSAS